jgi:Tfp pilus assembly protein FimT
METSMAAAVFNHSDARTSLQNAAKRFVNALVASRTQAAARELRRHEALIREASLVHGGYASIGLDEADMLPFNR